MDLARTAGLEFITRAGRAVTAVVTLAAFIRLVGAATFGVFVLFEALVAISAVLVDAGMGSALQKRISEGQDSSILSSALFIKLALLGVFSILVIAVPGRLNAYFDAELALALIPAAAFQQLGRFGLQALRGERRVEEAAVIQLAGEVLILGTGASLALAGYGLTGLVLAFIGGWAAIATFALVRIDSQFGTPSLTAARSLIDFSKHSFVSSVVGPLGYTWTDTLVIGWLLSSADVAVYETAWRVSMAVLLPSQAIATTLFPHVSSWAEADSLATVEGVLSKSIPMALLPVVPAIVGAWFVGEQLLAAAFSIDVPIAATLLVVLIGGKLPEALNNVTGRVLYGLDAPAIPAAGSAIELVLNLTLNLVLIHRYGLLGAAVATTLAFLVNASVNAYGVTRHVRLRIDWRGLFSIVLATGIMALWLALIPSNLFGRGLVSIAAEVATGALVYLAVLWFTPLRKSIGGQWSPG